MAVEESITVDVYPTDDRVSFTRRSASPSSSLRKQDSYGTFGNSGEEGRGLLYDFEDRHSFEHILKDRTKAKAYQLGLFLMLPLCCFFCPCTILCFWIAYKASALVSKNNEFRDDISAKTCSKVTVCCMVIIVLSALIGTILFILIVYGIGKLIASL